MRKSAVSLYGRLLVVMVVLAFAASTMPVCAAAYTVRGPEGNTITVDEDSVSGNFEGVDYYADEDTATADGHSATDDDGGGGGGGGSGAAIVAGLAVVAVIAGVGLWWYFTRYKPQHASNADADAQVALHQFNESTALTVTPKILELAGMETGGGMPDQKVEDLASFDVGLRVRF